MKQSMKNLIAAIARLHRSEQGAEGLEKLLIIGAVVIPLLGVLVWFRTELAEKLGDLWESVAGDSTYNTSNP